MHRDLAESKIKGILNSDKNIVMCETNFRKLLKERIPELRPVTNKHMDMCGCVECTVMTNLQNALNKFKKQKVNELKKDIANKKLLFNEAVQKKK